MKPITQYPFPAKQYIAEETKKTQIFLHHTAGNADPFGTYDFWASNPERIATCIIIGGRPVPGAKWHDGQIVQGFSSKYWAYHLGLKTSTFDSMGIPYRPLDKNSIGVEICNWGQLTLQHDGTFRNYVNRVVPQEEVCELSRAFRGFKYYHAYTDAQIDSTYQLIKFWEQKYGIEFKYNPDIWEINARALRGEPGLYTHVSVRRDKTDLSPQPKMIQMLESL